MGARRSSGIASACVRLAWCCVLGLAAPAALQAQEAPPPAAALPPPPPKRVVPDAGASSIAKQPDVNPQTQPKSEEEVDTGMQPVIGKPTAPPPEPERKTAEVQLNGVQVQGKHDVLNDSDKRLKALQDSLPCSGCDVPPRKKKLIGRIVQKAVNEVTPQPKPDRSHEVNDRALDFSQQGQCIGTDDARDCTPMNARP
jgi:hypothetical protein